ncbi:MAG: prepilin-type N-terminal cleavage/methylation domain-containing protein [Candidatus Omnitrophota bacterium]
MLKNNEKGMTLVEIMIASIIVALLIGAAMTVYIAVLRAWAGQEQRVGISIAADRALSGISQELRSASEVSTSVNDDEIRYTNDGSNYYIYYLYNSGDSYPPAFTESSYQLKHTALTGTINGTFTYGDGRIIATDVLPPTTTDFSFNGSTVTMDISITRGDETIRSKTKISPRNI